MSPHCQIVPEQCIACGLCAIYAPDIFDYDEEGIVLFKQHPQETHLLIADTQVTAVQAAYKKCPTRAILLSK
ncbi:MAG: ferredoxin [Enterococcus sp.]